MRYTRITGGDILCAKLTALGVSHVFAVPGTQSIDLFAAFSRCPFRVVVPSHELAAAFMAGAYSRSSGHTGVLSTIPGPGFAYTLAGIAEALHDSAAVVYLLPKPRIGRAFDLQGLDQAALLSSVVKKIIDLDRPDHISRKLAEAFETANGNEPGPVVVHYDAQIISADAARQSESGTEHNSGLSAQHCAQHLQEEAVRRISIARRPVFLVGQGANHCSLKLGQLIDALQAPVIPSRSARGIVPDTNPLCLIVETTADGAAAVNSLLERSDCVVVLGCKLSHNGSFGFRLRINPDRLIHVDASERTLNANYPAALAVQTDAGVFLDAVLSSRTELQRSEWTHAEIEDTRRHGTDIVQPEPELTGSITKDAAGFFRMLREAMPADGVLVTDTGLHQMLATRHFKVLSPRGFLIPTDFQSMGFGLPAGIAARLANSDRPVVVVIGDGGVLMSGMDICTAVHERIALTIAVFKDNALGQIRLQQQARFGSDFGTGCVTPDLRQFASAVGASYVNFAAATAADLKSAVMGSGVTIVEVPVRYTARLRLEKWKGTARKFVQETPVRNLLTRNAGGVAPTA